MRRKDRAEEIPWNLVLDESGDFQTPQGPLVVGGILWPEKDRSLLDSWGELLRERLPHIPWPFHQSHMNLPMARLFWYIEAKIHRTHEERFRPSERVLCEDALRLLKDLPPAAQGGFSWKRNTRQDERGKEREGELSWDVVCQIWKGKCQAAQGQGQGQGKLEKRRPAPVFCPLPYEDAKQAGPALASCGPTAQALLGLFEEWKRHDRAIFERLSQELVHRASLASAAASPSNPPCFVFGLEGAAKKAAETSRYKSLLLGGLQVTLLYLLRESHHVLSFEVLQQKQEIQPDEGAFSTFLTAPLWRETLLPLQRSPWWDYSPQGEGVYSKGERRVSLCLPTFSHVAKKGRLNTSLSPGAVLADFAVNRAFALLSKTRGLTPSALASNFQAAWLLQTLVGVGL